MTTTEHTREVIAQARREEALAYALVRVRCLAWDRPDLIDTLVDATEAVTIHVTREDCDNGITADGHKCALSLAARRDGHFDEAIIMRSTSYARRGNTVIRYLTPDSVAREITAFDRGADFAPGSYHLAAVNPSRRIGAQKPNRKRGKGKAVKKRHQAHITSGIRAEW